MTAAAEPIPDGRLRAARRIASNKVVFPALPDGTAASHLFEPVTLSRVATLYSYTVLHSGRGNPPLTLIYADFPEDARVVGRLDLPEGIHPEIGMQVEAVVEADDQVVQSYHFRPAGES